MFLPPKGPSRVMNLSLQSACSQRADWSALASTSNWDQASRAYLVGSSVEAKRLQGSAESGFDLVGRVSESKYLVADSDLSVLQTLITLFSLL